MRRDKYAFGFYILIALAFIAGNFYLYEKQKELLESNYLTSLITLIVGGFALYLYVIQKKDSKKDAAKIILQEIRRAEDIISEYKEHKQYKFTKKIIATNSWAKNIHYFVGDLDQDELDRISNLYSTGEYLDSIITKISDYKFDEKIREYDNNFRMPENMAPTMISQQLITPTHNLPIENQPQNLAENQEIKKIRIPLIPVSIPAPWQTLLDQITLAYEPIYHTSICDKLKKIAKLK